MFSRFFTFIIGLALLTTAVVSSPAAFAEVLTIAAGKLGGGYDTRAQIIAERLLQRGIAAVIANKNGSDEISLAVCGGQAGIGLMQIDAIYARSLEGCQVKPVAVYGTEVAVILFPPGSKYDELSDLQPSDAVMVDTIGSGTDLFWRTITKIETGDKGSKDPWASARIVNDPLELAQASAVMGDIAALVLVRKPDSRDISSLLDQGWIAGEFWDRDIDNLHFNSSPLYVSAKRDIGIAANRKWRFWGYDVRSFIVVSQAVATGDRRLFAAIAGASQ